MLRRQGRHYHAEPLCLPQHHRRGTCNNNRTITRQNIEARVLTGLKERLVSSEAVAEAVKAYAAEMNRLNHDRRAQAAADQKALAKIEKAIAGRHRGRHVPAIHEGADGRA
ncbi:hypothetical protein [Phyllobacterium salinisoli]|uniref:hypothetical protein n=1 Tax=Phyllobacterium salinisoli TaxID=1899321 RepID=UPI00190F30AC|nr:hypothetical protein [Phyllobacterium salinisoli]